MSKITMDEARKLLSQDEWEMVPVYSEEIQKERESVGEELQKIAERAKREFPDDPVNQHWFYVQFSTIATRKLYNMFLYATPSFVFKKKDGGHEN